MRTVVGALSPMAKVHRPPPARRRWTLNAIAGTAIRTKTQEHGRSRRVDQRCCHGAAPRRAASASGAGSAPRPRSLSVASLATQRARRMGISARPRHSKPQLGFAAMATTTKEGPCAPSWIMREHEVPEKVWQELHQVFGVKPRPRRRKEKITAELAEAVAKLAAGTAWPPGPTAIVYS